MKAVVLGHLVGCDEPESAQRTAPTALQVFQERLAGLSVPVFSNAPVGHAIPNFAVVNGGRVRIELGSDDSEFEGDARIVLLEEVSA